MPSECSDNVGKQALEYPFGYPNALVGGQAPDRTQKRPVEHTFGVVCVAPCSRSFLHIRAGIKYRVPQRSGVRRGRRRFPMGNRQGNGVNNDQLPAHFLSIAHGCRCSSTPLPVVDSQHTVGVFYQEAVAVQHTIFVTVPADVDNRIRQFQKGAVAIP